MAEHKIITEALKFDAYIWSPVEGIVIIWKEDLLKLDNISITSQRIHVLVKVIPKTYSWRFFAIYASTDFQTRLRLWDDLYYLSNSTDTDWLVAMTLMRSYTLVKNLGGNSISRSRSKHFWNYLQGCRLVDLVFKR